MNGSDRRHALEQVVEKHSDRLGKILLIDPREVAQAYIALGPRGMAHLLSDMLEVDIGLLEDEAEEISLNLVKLESAKPAVKTVMERANGNVENQT